MINDSFWVQIDTVLNQKHHRFWMRDSGDEQSIAHRLAGGGWKSIDSPMPLVVARFSEALHPIYVEMGESEGFFSLLSAVLGAKSNFHWLPVGSDRSLLSANFKESGYLKQLKLVNFPEKDGQLAYQNSADQLGSSEDLGLVSVVGNLSELQAVGPEEVVFLMIVGFDAFKKLTTFTEFLKPVCLVISFTLYQSEQIGLWQSFVTHNHYQAFVVQISGSLEPGFPASIPQPVKMMLVPVSFLDRFSQALQPN